MPNDGRDELLREVVRRGRFKSAEAALAAALDAYNASPPFPFLDGPDDPGQRAMVGGKHPSRRAAEVAALRSFLDSLGR